MPKTCNSAATSYATPSDFINALDSRLAGDLVRDDNTQATPTELLTDANLAFALQRASGLVETFAVAGDRYTVDDLQALTGNALVLLKGMVCGLAIPYLKGRRGEPSDYWQYTEAQKLLDALREGVAIFPFVETEEASIPETVSMTPDDFYQGLPTLVTNWCRYFGERTNRRFTSGQ